MEQTSTQVREKIANSLATLERQKAELEAVDQRLVAAESEVILGAGSTKEVKRLTEERNTLSRSVDELQIKIRAHEAALAILEQREAVAATERAVTEVIVPAHREMQDAVAALTPAVRDVFAHLRRYIDANQRIRAAWPFPKSREYVLPDLSMSAWGGTSLDLAPLVEELRLAMWAASDGMLPPPNPLCHHTQIPTWFDTHPAIGERGLNTVPALLEEAGFADLARELRVRLGPPLAVAVTADAPKVAA